jgi:hypothetical protein
MHMKTITIVAVLLSTGALLSGSASNNDRTAPGGTPPLVPANLATVQPPVVIVLHTIITSDGPGSWTREAFWDEYVVTLSNQGTQPLTIASAALTDFAGTSEAPGTSMHALEKRSTTLEQKYLDAGLAFARDAGPGAVTVGGGVRLVGATGAALGHNVGLAAAAAGVPVPYDYVRKIDKSKKDSIVAELTRRRLALPLTVEPGEARVGSLFFPMVPNPRSLSLRWSSGASGGELTLPLDSVHGLHVRAPTPAPAGR